MKFVLVALIFAVFATSMMAQDPSVTDPKIVTIQQAKMPTEAKESGLGGRVSVRVSIDETGNVTAAEVAAGPDWVCAEVMRADVVALREAARSAAMEARFEPATRNGRPVASTIQLNFNFPRAKPKNGKDVIFSAANAPPDYKGPVNTSGEPPKDTVKRDIVTAPPDYTGPVVTGTDNNRYTVKGEAAGQMSPLPGGKTLSGGVLNGKAVCLQKPPYPPAARAVRASGAVTIQVLIDEEGKVFSAEAVGGHPLLRPAARSAACRSEFSPTLLMGSPVKVSGVITYNFVP